MTSHSRRLSEPCSQVSLLLPPPPRQTSRKPLVQGCSLASFLLYKQNQYKETEKWFHFKVKTDLPDFCFTPYSSVLIQNLLWLLFATNRSHFVNNPLLIMSIFSLSLCQRSFPEIRSKVNVKIEIQRDRWNETSLAVLSHCTICFSAVYIFFCLT